jgi:hypothetical protein
MGLNTLFYLIIAVVAILWVRSGINRRQDILEGKRYCEENDLNFLNGKYFEKHIRLHFEKDGFKSWANYKVDKEGNIKWLKETPLEKIKQKTT